MTTTWCCPNHRDYIHIEHMYHTPCTHQMHPIPHSHEWGDNVLLIGDSYENIGRVIKRLDITIRFASFSVMNILLLYGSGVGYIPEVYALTSLSEAHNIHIHTYISNNRHHSLQLILGFTLMAKQFEYYCNCVSWQWHNGLNIEDWFIKRAT